MNGRIAPGTRLGKYQVLRFIAEGGMGELYVAQATGIEGFQKTVALKRILSRLASRGEHVEMFVHEAKLAATLHHPNLVQVFDIGEEAGSLFFTMEYVYGTDARTLLDAARAVDRQLPLAVAVEIAIGVAGGLHHAHEAGIIHRDISPANVLLAHDGGVKVTDFGVAKMMEAPVETRPGTLKGKVSYMSPEQCRNEPLDRRSDVFAIGILLYELSTLAKPFRGGSDFEIMEHIVHRDPPAPSSHRAELPAEVDAIVMRALQRDATLRYPTAQALQRDLLELARDRKLETSSLAVESYVRELFGDKVDVWRRAFDESSLGVPTTAVTLREARTTQPPVRAARGRRGVWLAGIGLAATLAAIGAVIGATRTGGTSAGRGAPECTSKVVAAPTKPMCAKATRACLTTCIDGTCIERCYANDPASALCGECVDNALTACVNAAGCQQAYDDLQCCLSRCPEPDSDGCIAITCRSQNAAYEHCAESKNASCTTEVCFKTI